MSSQNPVFIPGPSRILERLRHAVSVSTIDHRSASFGEPFKPLFPGIKDVLKMQAGEVVIFAAAEFQGALEADRNHEIKAVLVTYNETVTDVRSDVVAAKGACRDTASALSEAA